MGRQRSLILLAAFAAIAAILYAPALDGPFLSDDYPYIVNNMWLASLSGENLWALVDPFGPVARLTANWAPVHMLATAFEVQLFGSATRGYHVVNVLVHLLNSGLLFALLRAHRVPWEVGALVAALFLVHPANVEAVAWIFQLKTGLALALGLGALLLHARMPAVGVSLFALALLTKPSALACLAFLAVLTVQEARAGRPARLGWLAAWAACAALFAVPGFAAFEHAGEFRRAEPLSLAEHVRWLLAVAGRYVAMAFTAWGTSTFAQPARPERWLDGWVVLGGLATAIVAARAFLTLARGQVEAAFWAFAIAGYLPISQVFTFKFPMADRYLYFVLPGLLGALALACSAALERARSAQAARPPRVALAAAAALVALGLVFAVQARARARVWTSGLALLEDAAAHYPDGTQSHLLRASRFAAEGKPEDAITALERARDTGFDDVILLMSDQTFAGLHKDPRFLRLRREMATAMIERFAGKRDASRIELQSLGALHGMLGQWEAAIAAYERALAEPGPGSEQDIKYLLVSARSELRRARAAEAKAAAAEPES
jgi:tetratricopeptide (TPR) repeat protein